MKRLMIVAILCLFVLMGTGEQIIEATESEEKLVEPMTEISTTQEELNTYTINSSLILSNESNTLPFPITLRDFKQDSIIFEGKVDGIVVPGLVTLDPKTKKPIFTDEGIKHIASMSWKYLPVEGGSIDEALRIAKEWYEEIKDLPYEEVLKQCENSMYKYLVYHLNNLFNDVEGLNKQKIDQLFLTHQKNGIYEYKNSSYFPLDDLLYGNQGNEHNYHFTLESHTQFYFDGNEELEFTFKGDDDVWVFIDNQQVIDIGGVHGAIEQKMVIKPDGKMYRIVNNQEQLVGKIGGAGWYDFDFFFMERHLTESNLNITTNMEFNPDIIIDKIPYVLTEKQEEIKLLPSDVVYPGETVYYKFRIQNTGNVDLVNIQLSDPKIGLEVTSKGVYVNGQFLEETSYQIKEFINGEEILGNLNSLSELPAVFNGESQIIEISSLNFKYLVTEDDVPNKVITNKATVSATYKGSAISKHSMAEVHVDVKDVDSPSTPELVQLAANIEKSIYQITRQDELIYDKTHAELPDIRPGDQLIFAFEIQNQSQSKKQNGGVVPIGINHLNLCDVLSVNHQDNIDNWSFYFDNEELFNATDFSLGPNEKVILYTTWIVPVEGLSESIHNKVTLNRLDQKLDESEVSLKVEQPQLTLTKKVINDANSKDKFTIQVIGSDGSQYSARLTADESVTISSIRYGVTYTIKEAVPMNYELNRIEGGNEAGEIHIDGKSSNYVVTIYNEKINDRWFQTKTTIQNFVAEVRKSLTSK